MKTDRRKVLAATVAVGTVPLAAATRPPAKAHRAIAGQTGTAEDAIHYVTPEMFGGIGDGSTDDRSAFLDAIRAGGRIVTARKSYRLSSPIEGAYNVHIAGSGTILADSGFLAVDGDVTLEDVTVESPAGPAISGRAVTRRVNYALSRARFSSCEKVIEWRIAGSANYPSGAGIERLLCQGCTFENGSSIAFHLETALESAQWIANRWKSQGYACVWIGAQTGNRQVAQNNVQIIGNVVDGVASARNSDTATAAFQAEAVRVDISHNVITGVVCSHAGPEAWGIYTKAVNATVAGNVIVGVTGSSMNNIFVAMKGSSSQASRAVEGLRGVVSENILANTADVNSIGVHLFSEKLLVANNHMSGVGLPFEMDGTDRSSQFDLLDNVAVDPPPAHATIGADLRANGCVINVRGNTVQGYVNGFVVRTNAFDLPKVEFTDNDVVATDACYRFRDATGAGRAIASLRIAGGKCSGTYLARWDDPAVTPEVTIEDVDVRDIGNGILFAGAVAWRNAHVRLLRGHTIVTTGATPENLAFFELAPGTIAQAEISAVGQAADGTAAISKKVIDAWRRAASSAPERVGPITTVRDAGTASPDALQLVRSGNGVLIQFKGIDGVTMSNRITFDVTIISAR